MRALSVVLAMALWLGPTVQVYARTLSQAHCRALGYISMTAPDAAHDATHAAHHDHEMPAQSPAQSAHPGHDAAHAEQCQCGCLCGHAGVISAAILPSFLFADVPRPQHFDVVNEAAPPHAEHPAPQRPPAVFS